MKPGDFALRSKRSRAAARMILRQRMRSQERIELVLSYDGLGDNRPRATEWQSDPDGKFGRVISVPEGMRLPDALRMIGGYSEGELAEIGAAYPEPLGAGDLLAFQRE